MLLVDDAVNIMTSQEAGNIVKDITLLIGEGNFFVIEVTLYIYIPIISLNRNGTAFNGFKMDLSIKDF